MPTQTQKRSAQLLFASNMKRIRLDKKLTQESVAEGAGLHPNYIRETLIKSTDIQLMRYSRDPNQTRDKQHETNDTINSKQRI
jgi:transcriptional regulator with XRE-family HTH domain